MIASFQDTAVANDEDILSLQVRALDQSISTWFLAAFGVMMMAYVNWSPSASSFLKVWVLCFAVTIAAQVIFYQCRKRRLFPSISAKFWARQFQVSYLITGSLWGLSAYWFLPMGNQDQALFVACCVLACVTLSVPCVVYRPAFNLFQLPIFIGLAFGFMSSSVEFGWLLATGCVMMAVSATMIGYALGNQLQMSLRLSLDNKTLAKRLEERSKELELLNRELQIESSTDPLTGVANRRHLMSFARALRGNYAVIFCDIDFFKSYNDQYGHVAGDACLVAIARTLQSSVRPDFDLVARLGGEEFVMILSDTSKDEALQIAENVRVTISKLVETSPASLKRAVTASLGVAATAVAQPKSLAILMEEADTALYRAKASGRNRTITALDDEPRAKISA